MVKSAPSLETKFLSAVRRPCKFPGCTLLLSKYNNSEKGWHYWHTIGEVQIERKPEGKAVLAKAAPVFVALPVVTPKKEPPRVLKPFAPETLLYKKIVLAACFHFQTTIEDLRKMEGNILRRRQRSLVLYMLCKYSGLRRTAAARYLHRTHNTAARDATICVQKNMDAFAEDIKAICGYCGIAVEPMEQVQQLEAAE